MRARGLNASMTQDAGAFAHDEAVTQHVEGTRGPFRRAR
ncbi:hypothetical protein SAMCCGM7_pC0529 (plasmid) [Sinorhizobium americanum CCGM7]|nr:hypothetical protein SAMCCGM7_pC0529 [Sinorhizobium americanum CCGM7]